MYCFGLVRTFSTYELPTSRLLERSDAYHMSPYAKASANRVTRKPLEQIQELYTSSSTSFQHRLHRSLVELP